MKLTIPTPNTDNIIIKHIKNKPDPGFYIRFRYMHGDADGYTSEKYGFTNSDETPHLDWIEHALAYIESHLDMNRPDDDDLVEMLADEDFDKDYFRNKFSHEFSTEEELQAVCDGDHPMNTFFYNIPSDITCDDYRALLVGYQLTYVDDDGNEMETGFVWGRYED